MKKVYYTIISYKKARRDSSSCPACRSNTLVLRSGQDRTKIKMLSCPAAQDRTGWQDDPTSCPVLVSDNDTWVLSLINIFDEILYGVDIVHH